MIEEYGVLLTPLSSDDIELVRYWRNSDKIKQYARNKDNITASEQKIWFDNLDKDKNLYFVISVDDTKIGLIWANYQSDDEVETGFYIYEDKYLNSIYSYKIVTTLHNYLFYKLNIKTIYCDILDSNKRAIRFNLSLGFTKIADGNEDDSRYILSRDSFEKSLSKIKKVISRY
jgi:RimJ/RimL family protein N-acetyltransferase